MGGGAPERNEQDRGRIAETFGEPARHAAGRGIVGALEPHVGRAFDLPEKTVWLLETVGSPHVRLDLDNSHCDCLGRDLPTTCRRRCRPPSAPT